MTAFTDDGRVVVDSITTPVAFQRVAGKWYGGMDCMLYAVSSTGGLTTGTTRPTVCEGCDEKWYLYLWKGLSADVGYAERAARKAVEGWDGELDCEYDELVSDCRDLQDYEEWVDNTVIPLLEDSYGLEDWDV